MSTHNICFHQEIRKILCGYLLLSVAMEITKYPDPLLSGALCLFNPSLAEHDMPCFSKQCRSRSVGF